MRADESDLGRYLEEGRRIMAAAEEPGLAGEVSDLVDTEFEVLRWFDLPRECLVDAAR